MRARRWYAAVGAVSVAIALVVGVLLGNALGVCWSNSAPSGYVCPGGGGSCLSACAMWTPAFIIGAVVGLMVATIAGLIVERFTRRPTRLPLAR
jgi:mannitol-specific phosphotransferase system IIBC component